MTLPIDMIVECIGSGDIEGCLREKGKENTSVMGWKRGQGQHMSIDFRTNGSGKLTMMSSKVSRLTVKGMFLITIAVGIMSSSADVVDAV